MEYGMECGMDPGRELTACLINHVVCGTVLTSITRYSRAATVTQIVILLSSTSISESARQGSVPPCRCWPKRVRTHIANFVISSSSDEEDIEEPKLFMPTKQRLRISL